MPPFLRVVIGKKTFPPVLAVGSGCWWNYDTDYQDVHDADEAKTLFLGDILLRAGQRRVFLNSYVPEMWRGLVRFDLSGLPSGTPILGAILELYGGSSVNDNAYDLVVVDGTDITYPVNLAGFGDLLPNNDDFGHIASADFVANAYNSIRITAAGLGAIVAGGIVQLGLRTSREINSQDPGNDKNEYVNISGSGGEASVRPKLTVEYEV